MRLFLELVELAGLLLVIVGLWLIYAPAALVVLGLSLVYAANSTSPEATVRQAARARAGR